MKLISKTILYYLLISLPLLAIAGAFSFYLIKKELSEGTDESLFRDKLNAEKIISTFDAPKTIYLTIDSLSYIKPVNNLFAGTRIADTSIFNIIEEEHIDYRMLTSSYNFKNNEYKIIICKIALEEDELMEGILSAFEIIISFLIVSFFIVNWLLSKKLWKPFYKTLTILNSYNIKNNEQISFNSVNTIEFKQLNEALNKMIKKIHSDYKQQKEFTENASHEMQTPLAVINANLTLLMQSSNLKEEEMNQLQAIESTTKKIAALNRALILLSKIENNQFVENDDINIEQLISKLLLNYEELLTIKKIKVSLNFESNNLVNMNAALADILISNLLRNAIRHNFENGEISIDYNNKKLTISNTGNALNFNSDELFQRFKKNDASKDSLGLGLSIVKSIADRYNTLITYKYELGLHKFNIQFK